MKKGLISNKSLGGDKQRIPVSQAGFTLIELIMVVVILGILAAFALPKFASLNSESEVAAVEAARGAVKTAMAVSHGKWLAQGSTGTVKLDGTDYTLENGYPAHTDIEAIAGLDGYEVDLITTDKQAVVRINTNNCSFTYTEAANATSAATLSNLASC